MHISIYAVLVFLAILGHVLAIVSVLISHRRQPSATLAWLMTVIFLPVVGLIFFFLFGAPRARRVRRRRRQTSAQILKLVEKYQVHEKMRCVPGTHLDDRTPPFLAMAEKITSTPASYGNKVESLVNGAATYRSIIEAIEAAEKRIHVMFYTIQPDDAGKAFRDRLIRRAGEGIEVKVLYDHLGSFALPNDFFEGLKEAGGECACFNRVSSTLLYRFVRRSRVDFRNHRKIVVVDSKVGFTGGLNIGNEYLSLDPDLGHWRDTHLRIEGPAVLGLQEVFAQDWLSSIDEKINEWEWFPSPGEQVGTSVVQLVDSGPTGTFSPLSLTYCQVIAEARERVWLTTPYFVPDEALEEAIVAAALRGVDVRILVPKESDHQITTYAARSYYEDMLEAGARFFEYTWGFIHTKSMVVDSWVATVGSANLDMRSFLLNFEINAFVFEREFCEEIAGQFLLDAQDSVEVKSVDEVIDTFGKRVAVRASRLVAPML